MSTPKAVISNRIYMRPPEGDAYTHIIKELTHELKSKGSPRVLPGGKRVTPIRTEIIRTYTRHSDTLLSIPRGRVDLIPEGYEIVDRRATNSVPFPKPRIPLFPDQQEIVDDVSGDCFINAKPGWGKTFTALHLAAKLEEKALIVTHNTILRDHWIDETEAIFGITPGVIGSGTYDIDDHFIVVSNIQSLHKVFTSPLTKEFGTLIIDEAHHCPASTFSSIVENSYAKYRIGLSATLQRTDMRHILFSGYFSDKVYTPDASNTINPIVRLVPCSFCIPPGNSWAERVNKLLYDDEYITYVAALALDRISQGHKVLILADRVEFLERVKFYLGETCLLVTGATSQEDRASAKTKINNGTADAIAGMRSIFSEGVSINALSSVILATPIASEPNLEQIVGRVMRKHEGKYTAEVLDLQYSGISDKKQNQIRLGFYMKQGWEVVSY